MTTTELNSFREQLVKLSHRLREDVSELGEEAFHRTGDGNLSNVPLHPADVGTDNFEQQVSFVLLESQGQRLAETAAALDRIGERTFGRCEECQTEIPKARLKALPYTCHCIKCARRLERKARPTGDLRR
jgi:RNA polymerase-binding transcription factor DksA